jgi:hypothetical protein
LLGDLPNKTQNKFGILSDINLLTEGEPEYNEIVVNLSSFLVNYDEAYHFIVAVAQNSYCVVTN